MGIKAYGAGFRLLFLAAIWGSSTTHAKQAIQPPSVKVPNSWSQSVRFIYNRGEGQTHFLDEMLELTDAERIRELAGFTGFSNVRLTVMAFEFRSMEVFGRIRKLLEQGASFRLVLDPSTFTLFEPVKDEIFKAWSPSQQRYYLKNYDHNKDGVVDSEDARTDNRDYILTNQVYQKLQELRAQYPERMEIISAPYEIVPVDRSRNYPRMMHYKISAIEFRDASPAGQWRQQKAIISSANPTDSCLNRRISQREDNVARYLGCENDIHFIKGSEGNVQFGAVLEGEAVLAAINGPVEEWIQLFKAGKHFDDLDVPLGETPRVVFKEKNLPEPSILQAFFSEGQRNIFQKASDPMDSITRALMQPEVKLRVYYDSQFVFSHGAQARSLRRKIAESELEEYGVFVDGNFATQPYSALSELLFAPRLDLSRGVLSRRAIQSHVSEVPDWQNNVFVFEGDRGIFGAKGDKLHTKLSYFEYELPNGVRHHIVVFGSANKSTKAGRMNADGLLMLDSVDPAIGVTMRKFFAALREHRKMRPFSDAWLEFNFLEYLQPDSGFFTSQIFATLPDYLNGEGAAVERRRYAKKLITAVRNASPINEQGKFFIALLSWFLEKSQRPLNWEELSILFRISVSQERVEDGLLIDMKNRWLSPELTAEDRAAFDALFYERQLRTKSAPQGISSALQRVLNECEADAIGWGLLHPERES